MRWLLRTKACGLDISTAIDGYSKDVTKLRKKFESCITGSIKEHYVQNCKEYIKLKIPEVTAKLLATDKLLFPALDIVEIAQQTKTDVLIAARAYFQLGEFLELGWIRNQIIVHKTENHWESLSRESLRDDFDWHQRQLALSILLTKSDSEDFGVYIKHWSEINENKIARWNSILTNLKASSVLSFTMYFVVIRELLALTQSHLQIAHD